MKQGLKVRVALAMLGVAAIAFGFCGRKVVLASEDDVDAEAESLAIDDTVFPDANLRKYVLDEFDTNKDGSLSKSEREAVTEIDVHGRGITELHGVTAFPNLLSLNCSSNKLLKIDARNFRYVVSFDCSNNVELTEILFTDYMRLESLNVSGCSSLLQLNCGGNLSLKEINVSGCSSLTSIYTYFNPITKLDVSDCSELTSLYCSHNYLTELDLSNNTKLKTLYCSESNLTKLDVSMCNELVELGCYDNNITSLDLSKNAKLEKVMCQENQLKELDVSSCVELTTLQCQFNHLNSLDVSQHVKLETLNCSDNQLDVLDVSKHTELKYLYCFNNQLSKLNVRKSTKLKVLECYGNKLASLDVSQNKDLEEFDCSSNQLTDLMVTNNTSLINLWCNDNQLTNLDLSKNTKLGTICCSSNKLTKLDVSQNTSLGALQCYSNQLTSLDLSRNAGLAELACHDNKIKVLDVSSNEKIKERISTFQFELVDGHYVCQNIRGRYSIHFCLSFDASVKLVPDGLLQGQKPTLTPAPKPSRTPTPSGQSVTSVDVDDKCFPDANFREYISTYFDTDKDGKLSKSEIDNVKSISLYNQSITDLKGIEIFAELTYLECANNQLTSLDVSNCSKLETLHCGNNLLTNIDVSNNLALTGFGCGNNQLTSLDVSKCTKLEGLVCSSNLLTSIDVSKNTALTVFNCNNNQLTSIDVKANKRLEKLLCGANQLSEVDVTENTKLKYFECEANKLTSLDVSRNLELLDLFCFKNSLTSVDVSKNTKLTTLHCYYNNISVLDISANVSICEDIKKFPIEIDKNRQVFSWTDCGYDNIDTELVASLVIDMSTVLIPNYTNRPMPTLTPTPSPSVTPTVIPVLTVTPVPTGKVTVEPTPTTVPGNTTPTPTPAKAASIEDFVERLYTVAMNRASEEGGKKYWSDEIKNGKKTGGECAHFFLIEAEEFRNRGLSEEDFVETLYKTFFGRDSEPAGKAYWVGELKNKTKSREDVINGFIDSTEWCNICATYGVRSGAPSAKAEVASQNAKDFAKRLYTCCLGRDPETGGLKYWSLALTNLEKTGCEAAAFFFTGDEFVGFKLKNEEYVRRLYTTFMDREPASSEISYWVGEITKVTQTKESVLAFFGQSEEFTNICAKYGIERGEI